MFLNSQEAAEVTEERVDAMLALRRAEERRLAGSEVCARDWLKGLLGITVVSLHKRSPTRMNTKDHLWIRTCSRK